MGEKQRTDLIGQTGSYTRTFTVVDAKEGEDFKGRPTPVQIRISDNMGNTFWTELDDDISLD
ncbi:hypothetical protein [Paenibacillus polymyxa]|uniref:hypothetical protein n=1 Tax=Paenibacillus polymyxa TaxID=1406 RepID=UPI00083D722F|nr:hypothetical protein [Paenibacillus polymyxa]ODB61387.1 hypothetical protein A7309_15180 [Paenibacillus polymyxa]